MSLTRRCLEDQLVVVVAGTEVQEPAAETDTVLDYFGAPVVRAEQMTDPAFVGSFVAVESVPHMVAPPVAFVVTPAVTPMLLPLMALATLVRACWLVSVPLSWYVTRF